MLLYRSKTPDVAASPLPCPAPLLSVSGRGLPWLAYLVRHRVYLFSPTNLRSDQLSSATPLTVEMCSAAGVLLLSVCSLPDFSGAAGRQERRLFLGRCQNSTAC